MRRDTEYISPYSVRIRENADQNNSEHGHFSRSVREKLPETIFEELFVKSYL